MKFLFFILWIFAPLVLFSKGSKLPTLNTIFDRNEFNSNEDIHDIKPNITLTDNDNHLGLNNAHSNKQTIAVLSPPTFTSRKVPFISIQRTSKIFSTYNNQSSRSSLSLSTVDNHIRSSLSFDFLGPRSTFNKKEKSIKILNRPFDNKTPNFISSLFVVPSQLSDYNNRSTDINDQWNPVTDNFVTSLSYHQLMKNNDNISSSVSPNLTENNDKSKLKTAITNDDSSLDTSLLNSLSLSPKNSSIISFDATQSAKRTPETVTENKKVNLLHQLVNSSVTTSSKAASILSNLHSHTNLLPVFSPRNNITLTTVYVGYKTATTGHLLTSLPTTESTLMAPRRQHYITNTAQYHHVPLPSRISLATGQSARHSPHKFSITRAKSRYSAHSHIQRPLPPLSFLGGSLKSSFPALNGFSSSRRSFASSPSSIHSHTFFDPTSPTNISAQLGSSAYLPCKIRNLSNKTISWIRNRDSHILTVGLYAFIADQRFQSWHVEESDTWTLVIKYVQERDDGKYECQVSTEPKMSHFVYFQVVNPLVRIPGGTDIHVKVGSPVSLKCIITAALTLPEYIFWYKGYKRVVSSTEGRQIYLKRISNESTEGKLVIPHARPNDAGLYQCVPEKLNPANVTLHVINGEHPAAMQSGISVMTKPVSPQLLVTVLVLITLLNKSLLCVTNTFCNESK